MEKQKVTEKDFSLGKKTLRISAMSENSVRVRISADFAQSYMERYGIINTKGSCVGTTTGDGLDCGKLKIKFDGDKLTFSSPTVTRTVRFENAPDELTSYFNTAADNFGIKNNGAEFDEKSGFPSFIRAPKIISFEANNENFYGLGESNDQNLILNGRVYTEKVVYQKNEYPVPFFMSNEGWGIMLNTTYWHSIDVCCRNRNEVLCWIPEGDIDFFIFTGSNMREVLTQYTKIAGTPCILPKWAYGLTFIEQYYADQFEVMNTAVKFREKGIPCDTISLEPGWMEKNYDKTTKKKWNTERFYICDWMRQNKLPSEYGGEMKGGTFIQTLSRMGLRLQLWLCCDYDLFAEEERRAGAEGFTDSEPWQHHLRSFINDGVAAFKMDPGNICDLVIPTRSYANGKEEPEMHNLKQTIYSKQMNEGFSEYTGLRPMHHYCGGYLGIPAYGATTTGDSGGGHKTLKWIMNCGMSGCSNITCDMDVFNPETIHFGFFTAWCQLNSWAGFCHPWLAGEKAEKVFAFYDKLRYALIPYISSAAAESFLTGIPIVRAMPLCCDDAEAADLAAQYFFGDSLLVSAFTNRVWLPSEDNWMDCWSGKVYGGGQWIDVIIPEDRGGGLFVRCGSVIAGQKAPDRIDCSDPEIMTFCVIPGADRIYTFYEDDGLTNGYHSGEIAKTTVTLQETSCGCTVTVSERTGSFKGMNPNRKWRMAIPSSIGISEVISGGTSVSFKTEDDMSVFAYTGQSMEIKYDKAAFLGK